MKRIIYFIIGLFLTFACQKIRIGNDFLDKPPGVDVTVDTIFSSIQYAERFLWGAYEMLPFGVDIGDLWNSKKRIFRLGHAQPDELTDLAHSFQGNFGINTLYYNGAYNAALQADGFFNTISLYSFWLDEGFQCIRKCYIFLENIDHVPNVDPAYVKRLKAEATLMIAIIYQDPWRYYGGMPWLTSASSMKDFIGEKKSFPRLTAQATCDSIVALCDKAAADLPWVIPSNQLAEWDGRLTKASAMGLKARVLLFNASPLFNADAPYLDGAAAQQKLVWHGGYDANRWKLAADAAHDLITMCESTGDYKLYHKAGNTYRQDFQDAYYRRGTGETLISTRTDFKLNGSTTMNGYQQTWGLTSMTQECVDYFPMANGKPITDPTSGYDPQNPYVNRDPRLYESVVVNGDQFQGRTAELWVGGRDRLAVTGTGINSLMPRKFILDDDVNTSVGAIMQWPILRLPEIYLSYAEASNEFNNGPSAEDYRCVNIVRNRVGLGNLPAGLTKEQFREAVFTERTREFVYEDVHLQDINRWKRDDIYKKHLHGLNIWRSSNPPYTYTYELVEIQPRYWVDHFSPKWYLQAFPLSEVKKGYGLIQNPGWE